MLTLSKTHPRRPVSWRWDLAKTLRTMGKRNSRIHEDSFVLAAKRFQHQLAMCKDDIDRMVLSQKVPEQFIAYEIREETQSAIPGRGSSVNRLKSTIEAYILSGESMEKIARHVAVPEAALEWYEAWFFNVTDRRRAFGWVMDQVIGNAAYSGISSRDLDTIWKLYGYFGGPRILDAAVTTFPNGASRPVQDDWDEFVREDAQSSITYKAALAARCVEVNEQSVRTILESYARLRESEKDAAFGNMSKEALSQNIQMFMEGLGWAVGVEKTQIDYELTTQYDSLSAEPRADELLALSLGDRSALDVRAISDLRYPEQSSNEKDTVKQGS